MVFRSTVAGIAGAVILLSAGANPAAAQCAPGCDGPTNWTGFWLGAGLGVNANMIGHEYVTRDGTGAVLSNGTDEDRGGLGFMGTIGLGYDWQIRDRWVLGAFTDFDFGNAEHKETDFWYGAGAGNSGNSGWKIENNRTWNIGARVGLATSNTSMFYGLIGYSRTDLDITVHAEDDSPASFTHSDEKTYHGLLLGAGLEHDLGNGFSLKGEYRYVNYGEQNFLDGTVADLGGNFETDDFDLDTHSVRLTLAYKFGRGRDEVVEEVSYKDIPPAPSYTTPYK